jgi:hypothetical protein
MKLLSRPGGLVVVERVLTEEEVVVALIRVRP